MKKLDSKKIVINHPEKMTWLKETIEWSATLFGWAVWLFLARPLFVAVLWFIGFKVFYTHMIRLEGWHGMIIFFSKYIYIVVLIFLIARGWGFYNAFKYRGKSKRKQNPPTTPEDLDTYFRLPKGGTSKIQKWKEVQVDFMTRKEIRLSNPREANPSFLDGVHSQAA